MGFVEPAGFAAENASNESTGRAMSDGRIEAVRLLLFEVRQIAFL